MIILQLEDEPWDSGIAHYALTLSIELKRRGHEVHFWGREGSAPLAEAGRAGLKPRGLRRPWLELPALRRELRRLRVSLINAHTGSGHALAAALAAGTAAAVVRTRGDVRPAARHFLARALARRTRAFIAANSRIQQELRLGFPGSRVELVFQGIADAPRRTPLPESPVFGILGRLDAVKGHEVVMEAAARLKTGRWLAMGKGDPARRASLERHARRLGLDDAWQFMGFVDDIWPRLGQCRVGVVASLGSEAVSRAALEWMAAGRPVVASGVGCLPDLVEDGKTGFLVPPGDAQALAAALAGFISEPALADRLGAAARERFEKRFCLARFADETERIYGELLGRLPS
ncbi:MAG TPA: hypothetical protein DEB40_13295 [Elusimicrobia bacterium]|nr:hypothetical protein [Elusimicrobiota bacterium]HBT62710.1 hypothetical protein [Elusimicrobiota bacterium]